MIFMFLKKVGDIHFQDLSFAIILTGEALCFFVSSVRRKTLKTVALLDIRYNMALNVMFPPCIIVSHFYFLLFSFIF